MTGLQGPSSSGAHDPHLAHHFDTPRQQFESSKLGMWIFLSTEILLFGGLFCAYAVYRSNHPEIFLYAHQFLDKTLGGINTLILIASSFTIAWSVRAAQLGQQRLLVGLLAFTLLCGVGFLGIKAVEYEHKWKHGLLWGKHYKPDASHEHEEPATDHAAHSTAAAANAESPAHAPPAPADPDRPLLKSAEEEPLGLAETIDRTDAKEPHPPEPRNVQVFFSVYFAMTGLHGLHVIAGMVAIAWIMMRAARGAFSPAYFAPVDSVALYWHLVDLIWIYLFPLLYLIH